MTKHGIAGIYVEVSYPEQHGHRYLHDILEIIDAQGLNRLSAARLGGDYQAAGSGRSRSPWDYY